MGHFALYHAVSKASGSVGEPRWWEIMAEVTGLLYNLASLPKRDRRKQEAVLLFMAYTQESLYHHYHHLL